MNFLWCQLCKRYNKSYLNTEQEKQEYYEILKNNSFEKLQLQIDKIIANNKYFPRVDEILQKENSNIPYWMKHPEICQIKEPDEEEQKELDDIIEELTL